MFLNNWFPVERLIYALHSANHIISWFGLSVAHESLYDTIRVLDFINVNHGETSLAVTAL
jgi:hypothetical protein